MHDGGSSWKWNLTDKYRYQGLTSEESKIITKLYGIQTIPMNYLINPEGKVVAVHLRGEALLKKLEEVL